MWFCKVLPHRYDDDYNNDDDYSGYVYEQELDGIVKGKEQDGWDVSRDKDISVAVGEILMSSEGFEVRAFYLAGGGLVDGYSSGLVGHVPESLEETSELSDKAGTLFSPVTAYTGSHDV